MNEELQSLISQQQELLEKAKALENEIERLKELEALKEPVVVGNYRISNGYTYFKSNYRKDFVEFLRNWKTRKWNGSENYVPVSDWIDFKSSVLVNVPNVTFYDDNYIITFISRPLYHIAHDNRGLIVTPKEYESVVRYEFPDLILKKNEDNYNYYIIPINLGWKLFEFFEEQFKERITEIKWENETLELVEAQIQKRKELDETTQLTNYDYNLDLNGQRLKPFQNVGLRFVELSGFNCIIADEMGLGKTPIALAATLLLDKLYAE